MQINYIIEHLSWSNFARHQKYRLKKRQIRVLGFQRITLTFNLIIR